MSPIDGIGPDQLHINELIKRVKADKVKEVILATNASVEGETTALYINQELEKIPVKVTRLARGLPIGVYVEYADQINSAEPWRRKNVAMNQTYPEAQRINEINRCRR